MNGVTALALATGNDTRAVEAAVHAYAAKEGSYQSLTDYKIENIIYLSKLSRYLLEFQTRFKIYFKKSS